LQAPILQVSQKATGAACQNMFIEQKPVKKTNWLYIVETGDLIALEEPRIFSKVYTTEKGT
jgi:hypothetical protein